MFRRSQDFLYKYLIKTNVFISLCAVAFFGSGMLILDASTAGFSRGSFVVFFSTLLVYNVSQERVKILKLKSIAIIFIIALSIALLMRNFNLLALLYLTHLGAIALLYNSPLLNSLKYLPLRSIPMVKIFLIAYIWAGMGSYLPALMYNAMNGRFVLLLFLAQFTFILAITLPFDIRDFYSDKKTGLKTFPGLVGIRNTKYLAYLSLVFHFFMLSFLVNEILIFIPFFALVFYLIRNASAIKPDHYYTFYIDALITLQFLMINLLRFL